MSEARRTAALYKLADCVSQILWSVGATALGVGIQILFGVDAFSVFGKFDAPWFSFLEAPVYFLVAVGCVAAGNLVNGLIGPRR